MVIINLQLLKEARGDIPVDLVLKNVRILDVFNEEIFEDKVAVSSGKIIGIGDYKGKEELDLEKKILAPSFIDGHLHLESAMVSVEEFARKAISLGTTTVVADPHEIANVNGLKGIKYILEKGLKMSWNFNLMLPSCVPSSKFETGGAVLNAAKLEKMMGEKGVLGLGEVMDYPGVINGDSDLWEKLDIFTNKFIDGHAPGIKGKKLNAYLLGKIRADHECTTAEEALEKLRKGMYIMIREGSVTRDLKQLLPAVNEKNFNRFLFATDDRHPGDLIEEGQINFLIKKAVKEGLSSIKAIKLATINSANALGLADVGAIAPGYKADMVVLDNLQNLNIEKVFKDGELVAEAGKFIADYKDNNLSKKKEFKEIFNSINIGKISEKDFKLPQGKKYRTMNLVNNQIVTQKGTVSFDNLPVTNEDLKNKSLNKLAVVERHKKTGNVGLGLLGGFGLKKGAIATSVGHDSHNIIVVGINKKDMLKAVKKIEKINGGIVVVDNETVVNSLSLSIAGLMSDKPLEEVAAKLSELRLDAQKLGVKNENPFMTISFMALPVIPKLKVTDKGLFSSEEFDFVSLVVNDKST